jgi:broad specificity phosphatase PhoE
MTTTVILIRHGAHDLLGQTMAGRNLGVRLNANGQAQARGLAERLSRWPVTAIHAGPLHRVQETAWPFARHLGLEVETDHAFDEIDAGQWTGLAFDALREDAAWSRWNNRCGLASCPGGESFSEVGARVARGLERLAARYPDRTVAVVSHADIIKAAIALALGLPLDFHARFDIEPASVSVMAYGDWGAKLLKLNEEQTP